MDGWQVLFNCIIYIIMYEKNVGGRGEGRLIYD